MKLIQNTTNTRVFYVTSSLATPYYLVRLVSKVTADEKSFICQDQNSNPCSFVTLNITDVGYNGTEDLTAGEVELESGSYKLYLYDQASSSNLDYTLANEELLEIDCYVVSDDNQNRIFF